MYKEDKVPSFGLTVHAILRERRKSLSWLADSCRMNIDELEGCLYRGWWMNQIQLKSIAEALEVPYDYLVSVEAEYLTSVLGGL